MTVFFQIGNTKEVIVKMLNDGEMESKMVFAPYFVYVNVGDTITFEPGQVGGGHNAKSLAVPEGAEEFTSNPNASFSYKVEKEGLYLYACEPHKSMGMVGLIQVEKPVNIKDVRKVAAEEEDKLYINKNVYKDLLDLVGWTE